MFVSPEFIIQVTDNLHLGVVVINKAGVVKRYNRSLLEYFNIETDDNGNPDAKLLIQSIISNSELDEICRRSLTEVKSINARCEIELNNKEVNSGISLKKTFKADVYPHTDGTDAAEEVMAILTDITLQSDSKESLHGYKFAMDAGNTGYWDWDMITNKIYFSPTWMAMLGYDNNEVEHSYNGWEKLVHREDLHKVQEAIQKHVKGETPIYKSEARMLCKTGEYRWMLAAGRIVEGMSDGRPKRFTGIQVDINHIKQTETDLKTRNETLNKIAYITSNGVRTGLANILGLTKIIDLDKFPIPENREMVDNLVKATEELNIETIKLNDVMKDLNKSMFRDTPRAVRTVKEIMIVDDDPINNLITSKYIQKAGLTSKIFEHPVRAIEYLKNGSGINHDVILLDINMPGMDGFQFLREMEMNSISIDVIILTSSINAEDRKRAAGFKAVIDFWVKPLNFAKILEFNLQAEHV